MVKNITPLEYSKLRGISLSAVHKAIKKGHRLPFVEDVKHYGRFCVLSVNVTKSGVLPALRNKVKK